MCLHDDNPVLPPAALTRRNALAGAAALAGVTAAGVASAASAAAAPGDTSDAEGSVPGGFPAPRAVYPDPIVITGGNLLDPQTGRVTEDAVVILARGRVVAAGSRDQTRSALKFAGRGIRVIEADGRWVLPGLVDAHVHVNGLADAAAVLTAGATSARSGSSSYYQDVAMRPLADTAPGLVPRIKAAGVFVSPQLGDTVLADPALAALAAHRDDVSSIADLRYLTRVNVSRGVDVVKTRANPRAGLPEQDPRELVYDREQISAIVSAAGRRGVLCHAYSAEGIHGAVQAGVASIEHGVFMAERTMNLMARKGTRFTPTMSAIVGLASSPDPILAARGREYIPILNAAVLEAHERGVTIVAGTDSSGTDVDPIGGEVALLAGAGLSRLEALRSATTHAARLLGMSSQVGRLVAGYRADAIIVDESPLEDPSALTRIRTIIAQGAVVRSA